MKNKDPINKQVSLVADILRALSHQERLLIICNLTKGERSVSELLQSSTLSQSAFSQHLAVLRSKNIISARKEAQTVYYSVSDARVLALLTELENLFCD